MAKNVILPALGMAQDTGKIVQWLKAEGDLVRQGEAIAEIETDKVTVDLEAPASGILANISASQGEDVPVGHTIAVILAEGETAPPPKPAPGAAIPAGPSSAMPQRDGALSASGDDAQSRQQKASPLARRIASELQVDLATVRGTGPQAAIVVADIRAAAASRVNGRVAPAAVAASAPVASASTASGSAISTAWRLMAERTTQSWTTVPHFFLMREVNATLFKQRFAQANERLGGDLTYTDVLIKIAATALREHPQVNASWQSNTIVTHPAVVIGVAVAVPNGLLVPVIPHADVLGLRAIALQRKDIVTRAQAGKLRPEDLQGGTFTISNLGMYGIDAFTAIINAPEAAILAVGAMTDRVVAEAGRPVVAPTMMLSLSCDHRVVDGARGAQFLATFADLLADPSRLLE